VSIDSDSSWLITPFVLDPRQPPASDGQHVGRLQVRVRSGETGRGFQD
jgi:hypothetical protein